MSEAASVETLRAVNHISPQTLNAIMARHYPLRTAQYTFKPNDYSTCNVGRYLRATRQYGQRSIAVDEIMAAAREATRDDDDDFVLPATRSDPSDSPSEHQQRVSETYLDDLECNTTRNCLSDIEILDEELPEIIEYEQLSPITGTDVAADETIRVPPASEPTTGITDCRASTRPLSAGASILADEPVRVSSVILDD